MRLYTELTQQSWGYVHTLKITKTFGNNEKYIKKCNRMMVTVTFAISKEVGFSYMQILMGGAFFVIASFFSPVIFVAAFLFSLLCRYKVYKNGYKDRLDN